MNASALVAVGAAAAAAALVVPARAGVRAPGPPNPGRRSLVLLAVPAGLLLLSSAQAAALGLVAAGLLLGATRLVTGARAGRAATRNRARVVELCDALQAELVAGQTPGRALELVAAEWSLIGPAARAADSGGDVAATLRGLATEPGAGALRIVAAAWQVAHRTGHGLADVLGRVAEDLRAAEQTRRIVGGELASARATARLLAALPLLALAMGAGAGAAPWQFLLGHPLGLACLASGLALGYAGLARVEALARDIDRSS